MNEYCAHTVENYFMPFHYKNYESFNQVLKEFDLTKGDLIAFTGGFPLGEIKKTNYLIIVEI